MAIYPPGQRYRYSRLLSRKGAKRGIMVTLSLTAMVDMFTVLVIFLLQNYNTTGEVLFLPKEVQLPKAEKVKELKPAVVVTISNQMIFVDKNEVVAYEQVKANPDWMIPALKAEVERYILMNKEKAESKLNAKIQKVIQTEGQEKVEWNKVTVQADQGIEFQTIKKILYTVTEAGAGEINFAVMKEKTR